MTEPDFVERQIPEQTREELEQEILRLRRHLKVIFHEDCTCLDDTCAACIAEHALYFDGEHELVRPKVSLEKQRPLTEDEQALFDRALVRSPRLADYMAVSERWKSAFSQEIAKRSLARLTAADKNRILGPIDVTALRERGEYRRIPPRNVHWIYGMPVIDEFADARGPDVSFLQEPQPLGGYEPPLQTAFMTSGEEIPTEEQQAMWDRVCENLRKAQLRCEKHDVPFIYERGGLDEPTIHGRTYCPECQRELNEALTVLDEIDKRRNS